MYFSPTCPIILVKSEAKRGMDDDSSDMSSAAVVKRAARASANSVAEE
jgi:hypothetical protein